MLVLLAGNSHSDTKAESTAHMGRYIGTAELYNVLFGTTDGTINSTGGTVTVSARTLLNDCISRAESEIDNYTRRNFAGSAGTIFYNRYSQAVVNQALYITEDLHTLVSLTNGDSASIPVGSVWLEPRNSGPPYRLLRLKSSYVYVWNTDSDVIIAGTFGFSTVAPDAIKQAAVRLASYYFRLKDVGPGDVAGQSNMGEGQYPKGIPDDVKILLDKYRSRSGGVV